MKNSKIIIVLVLLFVLVVSCTQQPVKGVESSIFEEGTIKNIKITDNNVNIREGCSNVTDVVKTCNKNDTYNVLSKIEDWYCVKLPDNTIGFIPEQQCKPIVSEKEGKKTTPGMYDTAQNMEPAGNGYDTTPGYTPDTDTDLDITPRNDMDRDYDMAPDYTPDLDMTPDTTNGSESNSNTLTDQEKEMLRLVNEARAQNNLSPLTIDMELTEVARIKSQDMIDNNYFSHNSPTYGSPFDMMNDFGIEYVKAGENIAGNQSVQNAHDALMKSPGHRENILSPDFTHIGIGIKNGSQYGNIFTQMFISKPK